MVIGNTIIHLPETVSTNIYLAEIMKKDSVDEGTVVWADYQSGGRGEGGTFWESKRNKNLTISILLTPSFLAPHRQFSLLKAMALGVKDFVALYTNAVSVKWPNDIYVDTDKLAGILIENSFIGNRFENCLAGIGLNINQVYFSKNIPNAISMRTYLGKNLDLKECLNLLCYTLDKRYQMLKERRYSKLDTDYHDSLYKINKETVFQTAKESFKATIIGVEENGNLTILRKSNKLQSFGFKEIQYR